MAWRDNEIARDVLAVQGYYDEESGHLDQDSLAASVRDVFLRTPVKASADDLIEKKAKVAKVGLTKVQLVDRIFPGFREKHELSEDELKLLKKNPKDHPELEERNGAVNDISQLLWGTLAKTGRSGAVQEQLVQRKMLLVEAKMTRDGVNATLKLATDDPDLIIEYYVRPRGDSIVKVSGGVRDDCTMVGMTFEGITDRMKRELGGSVTTAIGRLMQVATPDFAVLAAGDGAEPKKALGTGPSKS